MPPLLRRFSERSILGCLKGRISVKRYLDKLTKPKPVVNKLTYATQCTFQKDQVAAELLILSEAMQQILSSLYWTIFQLIKFIVHSKYVSDAQENNILWWELQNKFLAYLKKSVLQFLLFNACHVIFQSNPRSPYIIR